MIKMIMLIARVSNLVFNIPRDITSDDDIDRIIAEFMFCSILVEENKST